MGVAQIHAKQAGHHAHNSNAQRGSRQQQLQLRSMPPVEHTAGAQQSHTTQPGPHPDELVAVIVQLNVDVVLRAAQQVPQAIPSSQRHICMLFSRIPSVPTSVSSMYSQSVCSLLKVLSTCMK